MKRIINSIILNIIAINLIVFSINFLENTINNINTDFISDVTHHYIDTSIQTLIHLLTTEDINPENILNTFIKDIKIDKTQKTKYTYQNKKYKYSIDSNSFNHTVEGFK